MKKTRKDSSDPLIDLLEKLLGPVEEMSEAEMDAVLSEADIDATVARRQLYSKVSELRSTLWQRNGDVPSQMTSLLSQLRPHDLPTSDPALARQQAGTWIKDLIGKQPSATPDLAFAARGREGKLSNNDEEIRRQLEGELRSAAKREDGV